MSSADSCGASGVSDYDQPLNIAAVFIILAASLAGTCLPLIFKRYPRLLRWPFAIVVGKHIGTGVLIALALIHLLGPAVGELSDPCLPASWSSYQYAPLFAMLSALMMHLVEMSVLEYTVYSRQPQVDAPPLKASSSQLQLVELASPYAHDGGRVESAVDGESNHGGAGGREEELETVVMVDVASPSSDGHGSYVGDPVSMKAEYQHAYDAAHQVVAGSPQHVHKPHVLHELDLVHGDHHDHTGHSHSVLLGSSGAERTVAAYILEFGLTSHSVIVGITLGVASHSDLVSLIPALTFHQFFEGFALGARLAAVGFTGFNEALLTFIYSASAPVGIAIGIGIATSYEPTSNTALLTQGTFDSISAGILLYVAFVQMMAQEFAADYKACGRNGWKKCSLYAGMWAGAGIMAVIGRWL